MVAQAFNPSTYRQRQADLKASLVYKAITCLLLSPRQASFRPARGTQWDPVLKTNNNKPRMSGMTSLFFFFFLSNLTEARVIWKKENSNETMPLSDWSVGISMRHFFWLTTDVAGPRSLGCIRKQTEQVMKSKPIAVFLLGFHFSPSLGFPQRLIVIRTHISSYFPRLVLVVVLITAIESTKTGLANISCKEQTLSTSSYGSHIISTQLHYSVLELYKSSINMHSARSNKSMFTEQVAGL